VVDDYYQKGKEINMSLARDRSAAQHGLRAGVQLDAAKQLVVVHLTIANGQSLPDMLSIRCCTLRAPALTGHRCFPVRRWQLSQRLP